MDSSDGLEGFSSRSSPQPSASASLPDSGSVPLVSSVNEGESRDAGSFMDEQRRVQNPEDGVLPTDVPFSVGNQGGAVESGTRDSEVDSSRLGDGLELKIGVLERTIEICTRVSEEKEVLNPEDEVAAIDASKPVENQGVSFEIDARDSLAGSSQSVGGGMGEIEMLDRVAENETVIGGADQANEMHTQPFDPGQDSKPVDGNLKEGVFARVGVELVSKASDEIAVDKTEVVEEASDSLKCAVQNENGGVLKVCDADDENRVMDSRVENEESDSLEDKKLGGHLIESNGSLQEKTVEKQIVGGIVAEIGISLFRGNKMTSSPPLDMDAPVDTEKGKSSGCHASQVGVAVVGESNPAVNLGTPVVDDEQKAAASVLSELGSPQLYQNPMAANFSVDADTSLGSDGNPLAETNDSKDGVSLFKGAFPAVDESLDCKVRATTAVISNPDDFHSKESEDEEMETNGQLSSVDETPENEAKSGDDGTLKTEDFTALQQPVTEEKQNVELKILETASIKNDYQASYALPQEKGQFSVSDLVWGKVRSHPWWPGQIFDPSDSSEMAIKYKKKGSVLVAYFGDCTFAWCEESQLKPFRAHYPQMKKQSTMDGFLNAVNCALDEVSRRVELGLTCSCMPEEVNARIDNQRIENTGIREGARGAAGGADTSLFEPGRLLEYTKELALFPLNGVERIDLVIAKAQLVSYYRSKGYLELPTFLYGGLVENDTDIFPERKPSKDIAELATPVPNFEDEAQRSLYSGKGKTRSQDGSSRKRNKISEDGIHQTRKQKSMAELMSGKKVSSMVNGGKNSSERKATGKSGTPPSGKKRKAFDSLSDDSVQTRKTRLFSSSDTDRKTSSKKRSFIVGDCIRRIAGQLTGSPPILKCSGERFQNNAVRVESERETAVHARGFSHSSKEKQKRKIEIPKEYSSPDELLSQLCLAARDPMKGYSFLSVVVSFFTDFRNSVHQEHPSSGKKIRSGSTGRGKSTYSKIDYIELSELTDMEDSYWTDRIIHGDSEEEPSRQSRKRKGESQMDIPKRRGRPPGKKSKSDQSSPKVDSIQKSQVNEDVPKKRGRPPSKKSKSDQSSPNLDSDQKSQINEDVPKKRGRPPSKKSKSDQSSPNLDSDQKSQINEDVPKKRGRPPSKKSKSDQSSPILDSDQKSQVNEDVNGEDECSPTALILFFNAADSVPSETDLSNIFSRYGPLKESKVMRNSNHAKVVFNRRSDAEVAFSSAGKFSIFGPALVSYQLKYLSSKPKATSLATRRGQKDEISVERNNLIPPMPEKDDTGQTKDDSEVPAQVETTEWGSLQ